MKKVLLLHGYNGIPKIFHWLKQELEKMQYRVIIPSLPSREGLRFAIWKEEMDKLGNQLQGELIVVAHSLRKSVYHQIFARAKFGYKTLYWACWF